MSEQETAADDRLRELAQAATPGPWSAHEGDLEGKPASEYVRTLLANREADGTSSGRLFLTLAPNPIDPERGAEVVPALTGDGPSAEANAAYIAAASPDVVLGLLAERDRLAHWKAEALLVIDGLQERLERAERWKAEALPVLDGLQEIGKALDLPLGAQITGPQALEAIETLRIERDRLAAVVARVEVLADEWAEDYPGPTAACSRTPDEWGRDLRAALDGAGDDQTSDR